MEADVKHKILAATGASAILAIEPVQSLWSGYGEIVRVFLENAERESVIAKVIQFPDTQTDHPRGWNGSVGHERKLRSYQIERTWYQRFAAMCDANCYCPSLIWSKQSATGMVLVLEDLSEHYPVIPDSIALDLVRVCISWLAEFHGRFLQQPVEDLWQIGCYWHLETRPDEFEKMEAGALKTHAHAIDAALNLAQFQTVVHGDAKLANFCFTSDGQAVAAVDFQYVGRGVGVKDLVYFFSSCLSEEETDLYETELLDHYFARLRQATLRHNLSVDPDKLEQEWRELYAFAWADFQRFLEGWSPGHWKLNASMDRHTQAALSLLVQRQDS